jgi:hypothetical protein
MSETPIDPQVQPLATRADSDTNVIFGVQQIKRMRGQTQSQLMRCDDGHLYVIKFRNNPQHRRVLANEFFATKLGAKIGLPVPVVRKVFVDDWIVSNSPEMFIRFGDRVCPCESGVQFGSRFVSGPDGIGNTLPYLPADNLLTMSGLDAFAGALLFDKWTCNTDTRQAVYWRGAWERHYRAAFIDFGMCFNGEEWTFPDAPLRGTYQRDEVYFRVVEWKNFEPWLTTLEHLSSDDIAGCADGIPPEWHGGQRHELDGLIDKLYRRRRDVRRLINEFRKSSRQPFPHWIEPTAFRGVRTVQARHSAVRTLRSKRQT